jgi:hypothetical protein
MQTETENSGNSSSFVHISLEANAEELFEIQAVSFNQHKRTGEVAEAAFLAKASNLGFCVAKPWGESERYDFIVDSGHHFWRVQVKSTHSRKRPSYRVRSVWGRTHVYSATEIDFLVAYVAPEDLWYVIPVAEIGTRTDLCLRPHGGSRTSFENYREAWCLMGPPSGPVKRDLRARKPPPACRSHILPVRCAVCPLGR